MQRTGGCPGLAIVATLCLPIGVLLHTLDFRMLEMTTLLSKQIERNGPGLRWPLHEPVPDPLPLPRRRSRPSMPYPG